MSIHRPVPIWGFPKIRGTILGVPIIRIIVYWGLYRGPLIMGNYHIGPQSLQKTKKTTLGYLEPQGLAMKDLVATFPSSHAKLLTRCFFNLLSITSQESAPPSSL